MTPERPRLLDLFCGAGGAGWGYHLAGFDVVGVDIDPQPDYPFEVHQADALEILGEITRGDAFSARDDGSDPRPFDAIHASPPCPRYSKASYGRGAERGHPDLLVATLDLVRASGLPWVVENVDGAPWPPDVSAFRLCGSSFGLRVQRHRTFASSVLMLTPSCQHATQTDLVGVYGNADGPKWVNGGRATARKGPPQVSTEVAREVMGMPWASTRKGIVNAIPPAYTEFIGRHLLEAIR